ncbi:MAG: carbohydrate-binding domain-containing protein, partial [Patescibacteria group bacterium]
IGFFDGITPDGALSGWSLDPDTPSQSNDVQIYMDGSVGGGAVIDTVRADKERPDVNAVMKLPGNHGFSWSIPDYLKSSYNAFYIYGVNTGLGDNTFLGNKTYGTKPNGDSQISGMFNSSPITVKTSSKMAGAITSLTWKGKEFVNSFDHGRELQTAVAFDNWGECYNPTEAGGSYDGQESTSVLKALNASGNKLTTQTNMAFWLRPGQDYGRPCNPRLPSPSGSVRIAQNTSYLGNYILNKNVVIGMPGVAENIIQYSVSISTPRDHKSAGIEAVTSYMPADFSELWTYDPSSRTIVATAKSQVQDLPIIISTADRSYAMGVYSIESYPAVSKARYSAWKFGNDPNNPNDTSKWNCIFEEGKMSAGRHGYKCYVAVGTFVDVKSAMDQLYDYYVHPQAAPVINSFSYMPLYSGPGIQLAWDVFNVTNISIDQGIGTVSGNSYSIPLLRQPTTYTLTATNAFGSVTKSILVATPYYKFSVQDRIKVLRNTGVYSSPPSSWLIWPSGNQNVPAVGTITDGPIYTIDGIVRTIWWKVDYDTGLDGWSNENNLEKVVVSDPTSTSTSSAPNKAAQSTVVIRARGISAKGIYPKMELRVNGAVLKSWMVTGEYADYEFTTDVSLVDNFRVYFTNDYYLPPEDRNLIIDYISVNGKIYQSEDMGTYAKGVYVSGQGCIGGFQKGETLHCNNSYFEYPTLRVPSVFFLDSIFNSFFSAIAKVFR